MCFSVQSNNNTWYVVFDFGSHDMKHHHVDMALLRVCVFYSHTHTNTRAGQTPKGGGRAYPPSRTSAHNYTLTPTLTLTLTLNLTLTLTVTLTVTLTLAC